MTFFCSFSNFIKPKGASHGELNQFPQYVALYLGLGSEYDDVVLVVAGEWLSRITRGEYPAPAVTHARRSVDAVGAAAGAVGAGDGPCIHATYRA